MHNWRLLILAFLAVLHPIASFTERNLVDGREQCCDRQHTLLRDTRLSYGTYRLKKPSDDRYQTQREEIREDRRYEVRQDVSVLTRPAADRRLVEYRTEKDVNRISPELDARFVRAELRRFRVSNEQPESLSTSGIRDNRIRDTRSRDFTRDERIREISGERFSRDADILRQHDHDSRKASRMSRDNNRIVRSVNENEERQFRIMMDSRRNTQKNQDGSGELRIRVQDKETRNIPQRGRDDLTRFDTHREHQNRRSVRERMNQRRAFTLRSESRLQLDNIQERRSQNRRIRESFDESRRSFSLYSRSDNRNRNMREESLLARDDTRDKLHRLNSRQAVERVDERREHSDGNRLSRDRSMAIRRESRERSDERRLYREFDSSRKVVNRNVRHERVENRRESGNNERHSRAFSRKERANSESTLEESRVIREPARIREERETSESRRVESRMTRREPARNREESRAFSREEKATSESRLVESRVFREPARFREEKETSESRRVESRMTRREPARNREESRVFSREERATPESRLVESRVFREPARFREERETSESRRVESRMTRREPARNRDQRYTAESRRVNSRTTREPALNREETATSDSRRVESRMTRREPAQNREKRATSESRRINSRVTREPSRFREERAISESRRVDSRITREQARFREERAISESRRVDSRITREQARFREERASGSRRVESRAHRNAGDRDYVMSRREHRSLDRLTSSDKRDATLSRSTEESRGRNVSPIRNEHKPVRNIERTTESRFRSNEVRRSNFAFIIREKTLNEEQTVPMNWQHLFYTLQGIYLCSFLMQILGDNGSKKKSRISRWWTKSQSLVKVD